jgi:hypothetical protein
MGARRDDVVDARVSLLSSALCGNLLTIWLMNRRIELFREMTKRESNSCWRSHAALSWDGLFPSAEGRLYKRTA